MKLAGFDSLRQSVAPMEVLWIPSMEEDASYSVLQAAVGHKVKTKQAPTGEHIRWHIKAGGEHSAWGEVCGAHHGVGGCHAPGRPRENPEVVGTPSLACGER